jgi:hypothetical protein
MFIKNKTLKGVNMENKKLENEVHFKNNFASRKNENQKFIKHVLWPMVFIASSQALAESDKIMGGIDKGNKWLIRASIGVSTAGIIFAGLLTVYNKERGFDKISGAIIGCILISAAGAIVALIQTFFGM